MHKPLLFTACILLLCQAAVLGQGFTDVTVSAGISTAHDGIDDLTDMPIGSGAAWFDYNLDGHLDVYVTNRESANNLYRNNGNGTFTDVATALGAADASGDGCGVAIADINNDGYPDIYLANGGPDVLLKNINGTSFQDITSGSGLSISGNSRGMSASFGDYNGDSYLDLYVAHHIPVLGASGGTAQDFLFLNDGDETFTDVSTLLNLDLLDDPGFIAGWTDYDRDNDLDIILINDCVFNNTFDNFGTQVFRNDGGTDPVNDWTFTEVSATVMEDDCSNGMGIAIGDINRDGWMDIAYTDVGPMNVFLNANGVFSQIGASSGVAIQDPTYFSWGCSFLDYDNDGWQDLVVAVGALSLSAGEQDQPCHLFRNNGDNTFTDMAPTLGLDDDGRTRTMVHADYDNDGDLDFLKINYDGSISLLRNDVNNSNHHIRFFLEGVNCNQDGIGSKIEVTTPDGVIQHFEMRSGSNLGGGDEVCAHFGIGSNTSVSQVKITWPSGIVDTYNSLGIDMTHSIAETAALPVELESFTARAKRAEVALEWYTASEQNNAYFEIERSSNGRGFTSIGRVQGQGNSIEAHAYAFMDRDPVSGPNYYRLRQVDVDGQYSYSDTRVVFFGAARHLRVFPNPASAVEQVTVQLQGSVGEQQVELFDAYGRLLQSHILNSATVEDIVTHDLSVGGLSPGIYILRWSDAAGQQKVERLMLK